MYWIDSCSFVVSIAPDQLIVAVAFCRLLPAYAPIVTVPVVGAANPGGGAGVGTFVNARFPVPFEVKLHV